MPEVFKVVSRSRFDGKLRSVACVPAHHAVTYTPNRRTVGYHNTPVLVFDTLEHAQEFAYDIRYVRFWGVEIWRAAAMPDPWIVAELCGQRSFNVVKWWSRAEYRRECTRYAAPVGTLAATEIILRELLEEASEWVPPMYGT